MAKVDGAFRHRPEVLGVTGSVIPLWIGRSVSWFPRSLYWVIGCTAWRQEDRESLTWSVAGVNMIFRRKAFDTTSFIDEFTDGFHKEGKMGLPGDDNDFATRLILATGFKLMYIPELKVYHKVYPFKTSLTYVRRYSFWQGVAEARYMSVPSWKRVRTQSYGFALRVLAFDIISFRGGFLSTIRRNAFLITGVLFASLGFAAWECGVGRPHSNQVNWIVQEVNRNRSKDD